MLRDAAAIFLAIVNVQVDEQHQSSNCWATTTTMQKVIQRTATARKQAQKKLFRAQKKDDLANRKDNIRMRRDYNKAIIDSIKLARTSRWEDYRKGDIAPKRDSGLEATTFGAIDAALLHPPTIPKPQRRKHILFAAGDRVCVIRGRDQGKINEITQVNEESETVTIKDINTVSLCPFHLHLPPSIAITITKPGLFSFSGRSQSPRLG